MGCNRNRIILLFVGKAIVVLVLVSVLLTISPIGLLYLFFGYEEIAIKKTIDNPYVNSRYRGWYTIEVDNQDSFRLPEKWTFSDDSDCSRIFNEDNKLWAIGAKFETSSDLYPDHSTFLSSCLGKNIQALNYDNVNESPNFVYMDGSIAGVISLTAAQDEQYFYMQLSSDANQEYFWVVLEDPNNKQLHEIIEAIIYSFEYS